MDKITESKQINYVRFSHWKYGGGEKEVEMYLYTDNHNTPADVQKWVEENFTNENDENDRPIVWEIKFIAFSFSMDIPIDKQDY